MDIVLWILKIVKSLSIRDYYSIFQAKQTWKVVINRLIYQILVHAIHGKIKKNHAT